MDHCEDRYCHRFVMLAATAVSLFSIYSACISAAQAQSLFDPVEYCEENSCRRGPSLHDPATLQGDWTPFDSTDPLVWGADVCLGYFLTKDPSAWNGGVRNEEVDALYGLYISLGEQEASVHIFDWPYNVNGPSYEGYYSVFQCENSRWPEHLLTETARNEVEHWADVRLNETDGWVGGFENWEAWRVGEFRNDDLGLTVSIRNQGSGLRIDFSADYFGPPIMHDDVLH